MYLDQSCLQTDNVTDVLRLLKSEQLAFITLWPLCAEYTTRDCGLRYVELPEFARVSTAFLLQNRTYAEIGPAFDQAVVNLLQGIEAIRHRFVRISRYAAHILMNNDDVHHVRFIMRTVIYTHNTQDVLNLHAAMNINIYHFQIQPRIRALG